MTAYKDGYEDILNDRRDKSDFGYAMKARTDVPQYKYTHPRSATKLKEDVISSDRVRHTIEKVNKWECVKCSFALNMNCPLDVI